MGSSSSSLQFAWFLAHPVLSSNNLKHQPAAAANESCGGVLSKWERARAHAPKIQGKARAQVSANVEANLNFACGRASQELKFLTAVELKVLVECEFLRPKSNHECIVRSSDLLALTGKVNKQLSVSPSHWIS